MLRPRRSPLLLLFVALAGSSEAALDLRNASLERLDNGLTVILLEDRNFPVVSVQMLYRVGARNEVTGKTGLAHFLEHLAFRASENFPDTALVSSIYARGGEWHGYTWTDQTTYYATVPAEHLDLLLRIEADRMARLTLDPAAMEAERGAVLAELHMYENDPATVLLDALMATSFLVHPYRNNTIGWESDVEHLSHADAVDFYRRHYHPANAVLAVVGAFDPDPVRARIEALFGAFEHRAPAPLPHTLEPPQTGERRVRLTGHAPERRFMIGYRAPAAGSPDFPAFLVLQELLGGGAGVSFLQNDWGTPVGPGTVLDGAAPELTTWYPPSAQDYLFVIGGSVEAGGSESDVEREIEARLGLARQRPPSPEALKGAIDTVIDELVYDLETTEDAAHQLAFFAGLDALQVLLELPARVTAVDAAQVQRLAANYLKPQQRTIAWYGPIDEAEEAAAPAPVEQAPTAAPAAPAAIDRIPVPAPVLSRLAGGLPVIVQPSDVSPAAYLRVVVLTGGVKSDPALGYSSLATRVRPADLAAAAATLRRSLDLMGPVDPAPPSSDPETRLEQAFAEIIGAGSAVQPAAALVALSGDVRPDLASALLEEHFGNLKPAVPPPARAVSFAPGERTIRLGRPLAQARIGYLVPAPPARDPAADRYRLLAHILSHDYEGRLGKEAISRRGLAYYIDTRYRSDGANGWVTLAVGVDPDKIEPLKALLEAELARLATEPPTADELAEAKAYLQGRALSAAQSNEELTAALARQYLWRGGLEEPQALAQRLAAIGPEALREIVPRFIAGMVLVVRE